MIKTHQFPINCCLPNKDFRRNSSPSPAISTPQSQTSIQFHTSIQEKLRYLKSLGVSTAKSPSNLNQAFSVTNYLKSKGFKDPQLSKLFNLCPKIFSSDIETDLSPVFNFLTQDLNASNQNACDLILRCPEILLSDVDFRLKPTLLFLQDLGIKNLNSPTSLNAHLLNSSVEKKFLPKIEFLQSLGCSYDESTRICGRFPAIFGYSLENNLRPKFEYFVIEMQREIEELKRFPQYFAFSLETRIMPRHLHLKERRVQISLQRMLLWSDKRFYAKWR